MQLYCEICGVKDDATKRKISQIKKLNYQIKRYRLDDLIPPLTALVPLDICVPKIETFHETWLKTLG